MDLDLLEQVVLQILHIGQGQLGSGDESAQAFHHGDDAAVNNTFYLYREDGLLFHILLDQIPGIGIIQMFLIVCHALGRCFCGLSCLFGSTAVHGFLGLYIFRGHFFGF